MWNEEGEGLVTTKALEATGELKALARLMGLSCEVSRAAIALYDTEQTTLGMTLMETDALARPYEQRPLSGVKRT
jgi:hypothetical protein